ncbi:hypothetical protein PQI51_13295 [Microbacterium esteraromaticum]|uniref:hypothetical protein n=1 Tax=Microbacterium esteraromaticum TaxID=57043 RepID=UPI00309F4C0E
MPATISADASSVRRRLRMVFVVCLVGAVASGCSTPPPERLPGSPGEPTNPGNALEVESELGQPVSVWARGSILTVTTIGSGSCPTVPRLEHISESEKLIELSTSIPGRHGDCTADLAPRTFELDAARDVTGFAVSVTPPR